ncbi:MAG: hypothetical protein JNN07_04715 [Verrucomicrobiales bacterium]|nr:hypothetical protein [Verrucomicrobiales bacterium]
MARDEQIRKLLFTLQEQGFLPGSRCSQSFRECVQPLIDSEILVEERSGSGRRWVVRDKGALASFVTSLFPATSVADDASARVNSVAQFRRSKALANDLPEIVTLRAWEPGATLLVDGVQTSASECTREHGAFSCVLSKPSRYSLRGPCALVENPAVFLQFERLALPVGLAVYARGICSDRLLSWIADQTADDFRLLHLPDYDPIGLSEYLRLKDRLGDRLELYRPSRLPELFARFSDRGLLENPVAIASLARLRGSSRPEVREIVALIDAHNAGLEQEALLL